MVSFAILCRDRTVAISDTIRCCKHRPRGNGELSFDSDPTNPTQLIADLVAAGLGPLITGGNEVIVIRLSFGGGFGGLYAINQGTSTLSILVSMGDFKVPFDPNGFGFKTE